MALGVYGCLWVSGDIRGRSDKYLALPPDDATIPREIYYRVVHCRRRLLSKF